MSIIAPNTREKEYIYIIYIYIKVKLARMGEERGCIGSWWGDRRERDH